MAMVRHRPRHVDVTAVHMVLLIIVVVISDLSPSSNPTAQDGDQIQCELLEFVGRRTVPQVFVNGKHIGKGPVATIGSTAQVSLSFPNFRCILIAGTEASLQFPPESPSLQRTVIVPPGGQRGMNEKLLYHVERV